LGAVTDDGDWFRLRLDFLRERAALDAAEADYVALVRQLLAGYSASGDAGYLTEAAANLEKARGSYPNSVPVWEHSVLYDGHYGTGEDFSRSLDVLARLAPHSPVIRAVEQVTDDDATEWAEQAVATSGQLLRDAGSPDHDVSAAAIAGLREWARSYPRNSTYAINLSLGLLSAGRAEEANRTAASAAQFEDGSFADAYNIGVVLASTGDLAEARRFLSEALRRALSGDERALALAALDRLAE
jgi:tetratricopeptide (TPR) repeat protein